MWIPSNSCETAIGMFGVIAVVAFAVFMGYVIARIEFLKSK